ncbi:hypothetical protein BDB01DRAFT_214359 [Pilobolus umbonatus]|nr:hypothetical protein BDB01DRAFT_214359 [Pilobolus umbonatus]
MVNGEVDYPPVKVVDDYINFGRSVNSLKAQTPFSLLHSFHGATFWGVDEMHLWGQNIGKKLWAMATDGTKYGKNNPFFLGHSYREKLGLAIYCTKEANPGGNTHSDFVDMTRKAGFARAVDGINFMLYIVPTLFVEALLEQMEDAKQAGECDGAREMAVIEVCGALKQLARICEITQQFNITNDEMIEMEGLVKSWYDVMLRHASPKVFTINQHLLSHLSLVIRVLGPLRLISSRPLERTVGQVKSRILSRSLAGKNSANVVAKMFREKRRRWSSGDSDDCAVWNLGLVVPREKRDMVLLGEYCSGESALHYLNSFFPTMNGGTIKNNNKYVVYEDVGVCKSRNSDEHVCSRQHYLHCSHPTLSPPYTFISSLVFRPSFQHNFYRHHRSYKNNRPCHDCPFHD